MKPTVITGFLVIQSLLLTYFVSSQINDDCNLCNGEVGRCVLISECPGAIERLREGNRPQHCGFKGLQPIVCCEIGDKNKIHNNNVLEKIQQSRQPGEISLEKCNETYFNLPPLEDKPVRRRKRFANPQNLESIQNFNTATTTEDPWAEFREIISDTFSIVAVGGYDSPAQEFPHMAALGYGSENDTSWACGGSLISENFVLTAAHCIHTRTLGTLKFIRLGDLNLNITNDDAKPQNFGIKRIIIHPEYKPISAYHDIALVELDGQIVPDNYVRPACLQVTKNVTGVFWTALGWGATSYGGSTSDHLQAVDLREFPHKGCNQIYKSSVNRRLRSGIVDETQVCAGDLKQDTCQGDSGGPLQTHTKFNRGYNIVGITSFGKACGTGLIPGVYTRVSHYVPWIESIVWPE